MITAVRGLTDKMGHGVLHIFADGRCVNTVTGKPETLLELFGSQYEIVTFGVCRVCGCTDDNCRSCRERTGEPCSWADAEHTLCSACAAQKEADDE